MANFNYFGSNVCGITSMPWDQSGNYYFSSSANESSNFSKQLENVKYKYLFAITTIFQKDCAKILEKNRFKAIIIFHSSHFGGKEYLTFWVKANPKQKATDKNKAIVIPYGNCSVDFHRDKSINFNVLIKEPKETAASLVKKGYKKVENMPIWYRLKKGVKTQKVSGSIKPAVKLPVNKTLKRLKYAAGRKSQGVINLNVKR